MADLTINDEIFHVDVEGDATRPALMLSNSLGTDLSMWDGQMPALTKLFRVVRYDSRGHGGSVDSDAPASIGQLGRDAVAILDALDIEKAHWIGLSMGGAVGLWLLANAPERIDRAVLANTAPRLGSPEGWNARITAVRADGMADTAAATMERWFSPGFAESEPEAVAAIHALLGKTSPQGYAACCAALRDMDLRDSLRGIAHDVLVISGRDDPVVPHADVEAFVEAIPGGRHIALAARHMSSIEAEAAFAEAVVSFLTAKPARAAKPSGAKPAARLPATKAAPRKAGPRKATAAKAGSAKRGSATGRSNAARNPLKKTPAKRTAAKKAKATVRTTKKKPAAAARRRPVAKATATRRDTPKVVAKKPPAKAARKTATTRRPTPTTTARSAVKGVAKKIKPSKAAPKPTKKAATKSPAKKLPATRRKATTKPGRPTGRRKP